MKKIVLIGLAACLTAFEVGATQYSKLSVVTAAKAAGKWDELKAWIASAGLSDEWETCSYLSDDYPQYSTITNAIVSGGVMADAELVRIIEAAKDTAISDEMITRAYNADMESEGGRRRWHGANVSVHFDTNTLTKTYTYADGYSWSKKFDIAKPKSVQDQMTDAEKKAARERAAAEAEARRLAVKNARIALLTTNMTAEVTALMAQKQWPEELARLYLQDELNKLIGTNVVDVVIQR